MKPLVFHQLTAHRVVMVNLTKPDDFPGNNSYPHEFIIEKKKIHDLTVLDSSSSAEDSG